MKIGICDDEKEIRELLREKVRKLYPEADISLYGSGEEVLAGETPEILLLDIQMQGKSGMDTALLRAGSGRAPTGRLYNLI